MPSAFLGLNGVPLEVGEGPAGLLIEGHSRVDLVLIEEVLMDSFKLILQGCGGRDGSGSRDTCDEGVVQAVYCGYVGVLLGIPSLIELDLSAFHVSEVDGQHAVTLGGNVRVVEVSGVLHKEVFASALRGVEASGDRRKALRPARAEEQEMRETDLSASSRARSFRASVSIFKVCLKTAKSLSASAVAAA